MVSLKLFVKCMTVMAFFSGSIIASDTTDIKITPTAYGSLEVGQIGQGYFKAGGGGNYSEPISHVWQQRAFGNVGFKAALRNRLEMNFIGEGAIVFSTPQIGSEPQTMQTRSFFYVKSANATISLKDLDVPFEWLKSLLDPFSFQMGYFPYKYNPDVRNLGEYLFRTNTYPLIVYSDFDYPKVNLLGGRLNFRLPNNIIENDLMIHSDLLGIPVQDWSISDIISSNLFDVVTLGAGISFFHYLSVYQGKYPSKWMDNYFYPENLDAADKQAFYLKNGADSALFDWKALKTMLRLSIDLKKLIPLNIFGENDLKLYGESDVIGTQDYPQYYNHIDDRIMTSVGFNFPGFKFIDLINFELEYCPNNSAFYDGIFFGGSSPTISPFDSVNSGGYYTLHRDPLRLSAYVKKTILDGHVSFIGQVARDHKKLNFYYFQLSNMSFIESLPTKDDWWWVFKTEFNF